MTRNLAQFRPNFFLCIYYKLNSCISGDFVYANKIIKYFCYGFLTLIYLSFFSRNNWIRWIKSLVIFWTLSTLRETNGKVKPVSQILCLHLRKKCESTSIRHFAIQTSIAYLVCYAYNILVVVPSDRQLFVIVLCNFLGILNWTLYSIYRFRVFSFYFSVLGETTLIIWYSSVLFMFVPLVCSCHLAGVYDIFVTAIRKLFKSTKPYVPWTI